MRVLPAPNRIDGTVVGDPYGEPLVVRYRIRTMLDGSTHSARLVVLTGGTTRRMHLACARARWRLDGRELPDLLGAVDLDLGITPATNLLPIRRLRLQVGERQELTAAWVRFPDPSVRPLRQSCTRLRADVSRYESQSVRGGHRPGLRRALDRRLNRAIGAHREVGRMWAQRIHAWDGVLHLDRMDVPKPMVGEALVQVEACAVGLTVLNSIRGDLGSRAEDLPRVPGHEFTGTVVEVGPGVRGISPGDRVMSYFYLACGACAACREGGEPRCENLGGFVGVQRDGGYAEYCALPTRNLLHLPDAVPFVDGVAIPDAIATPYHVGHTRAQLRPGETVVVVGAGGGVGIHMVQMAVLLGARVIGVDLDAAKLASIRTYGAEAALDFRQDAESSLRDLTDGRGAAAVIDLVGRPDTLAFSSRILATGGRLVLLTTFPEVAMPVRPRDLVLREQTILGSRYASRREVAEAAELVAQGYIRPVVSRAVPLEEVREIHSAILAGTLLGRGAALCGHRPGGPGASTSRV